MVSTLGGALALGSVMGVISYTGRSMFESAGDRTFNDRLAHKEEAIARYRRPLNETINELGEGRGKEHLQRDLVVWLIDMTQAYTDRDMKRDEDRESRTDMASMSNRRITRANHRLVHERSHAAIHRCHLSSDIEHNPEGTQSMKREGSSTDIGPSTERHMPCSINIRRASSNCKSPLYINKYTTSVEASNWQPSLRPQRKCLRCKHFA